VGRAQAQQRRPSGEEGRDEAHASQHSRHSRQRVLALMAGQRRSQRQRAGHILAGRQWFSLNFRLGGVGWISRHGLHFDVEAPATIIAMFPASETVTARGETPLTRHSFFLQSPRHYS
jgi:hypothetical protein